MIWSPTGRTRKAPNWPLLYRPLSGCRPPRRRGPIPPRFIDVWHVSRNFRAAVVMRPCLPGRRKGSVHQPPASSFNEALTLSRALRWGFPQTWLILLNLTGWVGACVRCLGSSQRRHSSRNCSFPVTRDASFRPRSRSITSIISRDSRPIGESRRIIGHRLINGEGQSGTGSNHATVTMAAAVPAALLAAALRSTVRTRRQHRRTFRRISRPARWWSDRRAAALLRDRRRPRDALSGRRRPRRQAVVRHGDDRRQVSAPGLDAAGRRQARQA